MRLLPSIAAGITMLAWTGLAAATPGTDGDSGYKGGEVCSDCHGKNGSVDIKTDLPDTVNAGDTLNVTLTVTGTNTACAPTCKTSFNGRFDGSTTTIAGAGTKTFASIPGEIDAANTPQDGSTGTFKFQVKVPSDAVSMSFTVAAINANGDGKNSGDYFGTAFFPMTILGGAGGGTSGGNGATASGSSGDATGTTSTDVDAGAAPIIAHPVLPDGDPGCATSRNATPDVTALVAAGAVVIGLTRRRKRR